MVLTDRIQQEVRRGGFAIKSVIENPISETCTSHHFCRCKRHFYCKKYE